MKIPIPWTLVLAALVCLGVSAQTENTQRKTTTATVRKGTAQAKSTSAPTTPPGDLNGPDEQLAKANKDAMESAAKLQVSVDALNSLTSKLATAYWILVVLGIALALVLGLAIGQLSRLRKLLGLEGLATRQNVTDAVDTVRGELNNLARSDDVTGVRDAVTEAKDALQTRLSDVNLRITDVNHRITETRTAIPEAIAGQHAPAHPAHPAEPKKA
jgi:hypothetical protein